MKRIGIYLIILGLAAVVLPHFGYQLRILSQLGENRDYVAGGIAVVGVLLVVLGSRKRAPQDENAIKS